MYSADWTHGLDSRTVLVDSTGHVLKSCIHITNSVLMIRVENCPDICFPIVNLLTSPLIMHSKFVWSNLV